jgi:glycosyltransferase involved in cell wall biosynthesis
VIPDEPALAVSVVMPCLNEAETVAACVGEALTALRGTGLVGEVIVADNGSTDGSPELADRAGARVVSVPEKGYGAALLGGIAVARGRYVVMGDADLSYDFGAVPELVRELERGNDLVMGSRFRGRIEPGAMPFLHRRLGNPVLSALGRLFFRIEVSDFHCGLRAFKRDAIERLGLVTTGMEFASEMIVKAALLGLKISEIPVTLRKDGRSRPPHLRTWRDGWRHLRFLLLYSPRWLFLAPGLALVVLGSALGLWLLPGPRHAFGTTLDVHTMLGAAAMVLVGAQAVAFAVFAKVFAITEGLLPPDRALEKAFKHVTLEVGLVGGALLALAGLALVGVVLHRWAGVAYGDLPYAETMRWMIPGATLLTLGAQAALSSFFLSILGLKRR